VAVVGGGRTAAAQQLARAGHDVTVFETTVSAIAALRDSNFKMEKHLIDRRRSRCAPRGWRGDRVWAGAGGRPAALAIPLLAGGAGGHNLNVPGRELKGIHFAMDFLPQQNKVCEGDTRGGRF
jgi:glutamate synthase (NADPH/NADH) small chain